MIDSKIDAALDGKSILVTGATGSFGQRFIRQILARYQPERLIIFSRDELKQHDMELDLPASEHPCLRYFIGDVRDLQRLIMAFRGVDIVVHAAALKQVTRAEYNPFECIHTNVVGAENVLNAAIQTGVDKVVALSTDKAVNPINLYGASKLAADKIFVAGNHLSGQGGTAFSIVRYGNVIGSRGSVVDVFRRLVAQGAVEVPITDPEMTRFWITLDQGVDFVLSCIGMMHGGEIFVPKLTSMRVTDLAEYVAPGLKHRIVGIRPGEKMHETLITEDDARYTCETDDRFIIEPAFNWWTAQKIEYPNSRRVAKGFRYSSDTNTDWLDAAGIQRILEDA